MPYSNNPIFPETANTKPQVQTSDFGNKDLQKIEETLEQIKANQPATSSGLVQQFIAIDLPTGITTISQEVSTFSIANIDEGDTGNLIVDVVDGQNNISKITIKPGVIYNFPYFPGRTINIEQVENLGVDEKQLTAQKL